MPEPVDAAVLLGVLERELEAEADPEHRPPLGDPRAQPSSSPCRRSSSIAERAEPTPGSTARSAPATSSTSSAPSRRIAISTERMFPAR